MSFATDAVRSVGQSLTQAIAASLKNTAEPVPYQRPAEPANILPEQARQRLIDLRSSRADVIALTRALGDELNERRALRASVAARIATLKQTHGQNDESP